MYAATTLELESDLARCRTSNLEPLGGHYLLGIPDHERGLWVRSADPTSFAAR